MILPFLWKPSHFTLLTLSTQEQHTKAYSSCVLESSERSKVPWFLPPASICIANMRGEAQASLFATANSMLDLKLVYG